MLIFVLERIYYFMKRPSKQKAYFPQYTTEMVRIVISGTKKQSSPSRKLFSVLWIIGAFLVIIIYVFIPILIAFRQIANVALGLLLAASLILIAELVISFILLKIANPSRTPSLMPQRYQPPVPVAPPAPKFAQTKIPTTPIPDVRPEFLSQFARRPQTKLTKPAPQFSKIRTFSPPVQASQPYQEGKTGEIALPKRLQLPSR